MFDVLTFPDVIYSGAMIVQGESRIEDYSGGMHRKGLNIYDQKVICHCLPLDEDNVLKQNLLLSRS